MGNGNPDFDLRTLSRDNPISLVAERLHIRKF
jgi:hypothetical protein